MVALGEPLSFWGGFDQDTGRIIDRHHPQFDTTLTGRVVLMSRSRGSSSSPEGGGSSASCRSAT